MRLSGKPRLSPILSVCTIFALLTGAGGLLAFHYTRDTPPPVEFILSADNTDYRVGDIPILTLQAVNRTDQELVLLKPREGSDVGLAFPSARFVISPSVQKDDGPCTFPGPVHDSLFVTLEPGETTIFDQVSLYAQEFGATSYEIRFRYSTDPAESFDRSWPPVVSDVRLDSPDSSESLIKRIPTTTTESNAVTLNFKPFFSDPFEAMAQGNPAQVIRALQPLLKTSLHERPDDMVPALLDTVDRLYDPDSRSYGNLLRLVLTILARNPRPDIADRIWTVISSDPNPADVPAMIRSFRPYTYDALLTIIMASDPKKRESRLEFLFTPLPSGVHFMPISTNALRILYSASGTDIDRLLHSLAETPERFDECHPNVYRELERQLENRGVAPVHS